MRLGMNAWALGLESSAVIGLRRLKIAAGGAEAEAETRRMEMDAVLALQKMAFTGGLGATPQRAAARTVAHYRRKVRANHRRLGG
ncbi:hypothetical protein [Phenylobacterium sp.]|uniref:hypothetical protein n=1 Tax=Phenylobacterium sp. TaxID=1871053 RepID=UPI003D288066